MSLPEEIECTVVVEPSLWTRLVKIKINDHPLNTWQQQLMIFHLITVGRCCYCSHCFVGSRFENCYRRIVPLKLAQLVVGTFDFGIGIANIKRCIEEQMSKDKIEFRAFRSSHDVLQMNYILSSIGKHASTFTTLYFCFIRMCFLFVCLVFFAASQLYHASALNESHYYYWNRFFAGSTLDFWSDLQMCHG